MEQPIQQRSYRRSREEWQQLVEQFEQSGLNQKEFCDSNDVNYDRLGFWKRRLRKLDSTSNLFVEMTKQITPPVTSNSAWDVELDLGNGTVLRLRKS
ncbi:MAG: hypothetical protein QGI86_27695 [Candidatus Poribacteria bacterium]|jgi:hypothetical protein|nr:hypothetical protein [Candidatus Poribacteria bacterium]|tara:strand:- start:2053 stop:2343 length:291 start_codon:yes stop_codon:yes gene_type:complete